MIPAVYALFLVAVSSISVSNVYSQSNDCGYASEKDIEKGLFPWMVTIEKKSGDTSIKSPIIVCEGFLIDHRHFLTAASCVLLEDNLNDFTVRVFDKNRWTEGEKYNITCITQHFRYDPQHVYDNIAILTLSRDVYAPNFSPICLPDDNFRTQRLDGLKLAIWRPYYAHDVPGFPGLTILSNKDCNTFLFNQTGWSEFFPGAVSGDMLCTVSSRRESCSARPGRPLMYKNDRNKFTAIGLSLGRIKCQPETPRMYMKISDYVEWIVENTANGKGECN